MKYAIISDTHGNNHALQAVLADAAAQGVDTFLLLGDYASSFPQGNDVVNTIRGLKSAVVVRGNGEDYFAALNVQDLGTFTHQQFKPMYWGFTTLSPGNLEYLLGLPKNLTISDGDTKINLTHAMDLFYRQPKIKLFWSRHFRELMATKPFTHQEYLQLARDSLLSTPGAQEEILTLPQGIYLLGHNHLQFYMEYEGRLFINPGSCGEPLDWDTRAPYTILTITGSRPQVEERRVEYDVQLIINELDTSGFTEYAPVWSSIMKIEAAKARDHFAPFVDHIMETGRAFGEYQAPVSNAVWEEAIKTWKME
ncbi:MAG: metallophosphatase family protein [Firmicutes bacterium]|nr:metallophosphatase family protein [Bacillota bacterium]